MRLLVIALMFVGLAACAAVAADDAPPLPPGLEGTPPAASTEPALPAGLGGTTTAPTEPALPAGLDGPQDAAAPGLPPGLEDKSAPAVPPGLETQPAANAPANAAVKKPRLRDLLPLSFYGFWETRAGVRTQSDPAAPDDAVLGETRLQLKTEKTWDRLTFEYTGDAYLDGVLEEAAFDLRELRLTWTPVKSMDVRIGQQVLTWGTGDMLFINDLFPKDWPSFFSGRDQDYLKAPSPTVRVGWFHDVVNVDFAYTPRFEPDRYITGKRITYYNPMRLGPSGAHHQVKANGLDEWFQDDEFALRLYRSVGSSELAVYGYSGYWKSPGGQQFLPPEATFPKLRVYGASFRGTVGKGIGHAEIGYYDSYQDRAGDRSLINNSEFRLLLGYEQELAKELTGAVQYYVEHMMDYDAYKATRLPIMPLRDENRHVVTIRLTKLLMNQNLILSFFSYYSPSDGDAYLRPKVTYKANDHWTLETGGNVFVGRSDTSFFGQFQDNTNVYAGARYSF